MSNPLRTGIIGTGGWETHITEQFHENPDADVVSLTDVVAENRKRAGETLEVSPDYQYEDHEVMLDGVELDAVQITSPHDFHYSHTVGDDGGRSIFEGTGWSHREAPITDVDGNEQNSVAANLSSYDKVELSFNRLETARCRPKSLKTRSTRQR
ncbi:Gfo/Idh/MocA family oxidoreductase [Halomontanus rarus]|uniref:Gfo/Idh/MocA family oxidoreductase n=1 Tax=Halomontanus rarus TaxID=3034020 RepID=UPI0023E75AA4|nr:Gfo/Idh/MocA family oxidoreductase [Halovivax sp. TS33]